MLDETNVHYRACASVYLKHKEKPFPLRFHQYCFVFQESPVTPDDIFYLICDDSESYIYPNINFDITVLFSISLHVDCFVMFSHHIM
jgi:hypothetical protein